METLSAKWERLCASSRILRFVDVNLRGVGQVMFQNNPLSGAFFLAAIGWGSYAAGAPHVAIAGLLALIVATLTAKWLRVDEASLNAGLYGFNGILVGLALATFLAPAPLLWVYVILGATVSVIVMLGTANAVKSWGSALTFPFVLTTWLLLLATYGFSGLIGVALPSGNVVTAFQPYEANSLKVLDLVQGVFQSISQVFLKGSSVAALLLLAGLAVNSLVAAAFALAGAILAVLTAHLFGAESELITGGLLGFSPVLTAIALGTVFYQPSLRVAAYAALGTVFTVIAQAALNVALTPFAIPALYCALRACNLDFSPSTSVFRTGRKGGHRYCEARYDLTRRIQNAWASPLRAELGQLTCCGNLLIVQVYWMMRSRHAPVGGLERRSIADLDVSLAERLSHGTPRDIARARAVDVVGLSGLERAAVGACGRTYGRCDVARAAARPLDADFHGQRIAFCRAMVSLIPAWRTVRQAHGRQRLDHLHRSLLDGTAGTQRAMLSVVLASAVVTYGGVSVFVAFFVLVPMAQELFQAADIPRRLMAPAIALGAFSFTMTALPGTPALQNAIPMPFFGTTPFAAPGLGIIASAIILAFGMWWLNRAEASARKAGEGYGGASDAMPPDDEKMREHATVARDFDPAEISHGKHSDSNPPFVLAVLPLVVVIVVNFLMSLVVLPRLDFSFLENEVWGGTTIGAVAGVWSVLVALTAAIVTVIIINYRSFAGHARNCGRRRQCLRLAGADGRQPGGLRRCGGGPARRSQWCATRCCRFRVAPWCRSPSP